jgi:tetratricopeptide (TPR) repeat protein
MGHYRVLTGYSDPDGHFIADDSYNGPGVTLEYEEFDQLWRVFNRAYAVAYPPDISGSVAAAIGPDLDDATMHSGAVATAQSELGSGDSASDAFGWFNLAGSLLALGDTASAAAAYDQARAIGLPWRMLWYQTGPFEAYAAEGRWDDVVALADANLRNAPNLEETLYWLGRARLARGDKAGALEAWQQALAHNPLYAAAEEALGQHR